MITNQEHRKHNTTEYRHYGRNGRYEHETRAFPGLVRPVGRWSLWGRFGFGRTSRLVGKNHRRPALRTEALARQHEVAIGAEDRDGQNRFSADAAETVGIRVFMTLRTSRHD